MGKIRPVPTEGIKQEEAVHMRLSGVTLFRRYLSFSSDPRARDYRADMYNSKEPGGLDLSRNHVSFRSVSHDAF
jgi:hypothetical protein